jgi:hypothetical protein
VENFQKLLKFRNRWANLKKVGNCAKSGKTFENAGNFERDGNLDNSAKFRK